MTVITFCIISVYIFYVKKKKNEVGFRKIVYLNHKILRII